MIHGNKPGTHGQRLSANGGRQHSPSSTMSGETQIADLSKERSRLRVTGGDRVTFLHGQCTNDIKRLRLGESCYAAFLNAKGKMRGEGHIICLEDAFLLEVNVGLAPSLEKFIITEDVVIEDVSATMGEWLVVGAASPPRPDRPIAAWTPLLQLTFAHVLGFGMMSATAMTPTISPEQLEVLRVEAGVPKWGVDMDENTIPIEAGLEQRAISYDKGCYIGQETIARINTYGHVNRRLVQLELRSPLTRPADTLSPRDARGEGWGEGSLPVRGEKIYADDREVGHVTSAAFSLRLGKPVALGYVRRDVAKPGTKLRIGEQEAEVIKLCGE